MHCVCTIYTSVSATAALLCRLFCLCKQLCQGKPCYLSAGSQQACCSGAAKGYVSAACSAEAKLSGFTESDLA